MSKNKGIPKSVLARSGELIRLAARMGGEEIKHRIQHVGSDIVPELSIAKQLEQMKLLVDSLSRLKGAAMKVGQLISMDFADYFPNEVRAILEQLQNNANHCLPFDEVERALRAELGDRYADLSEISETPIAAASIGQVHTAKYAGEAIVLKVQYPGVCNCIEADLNLLRGLAQTLLALARRKIDLNPLFEELKRVFAAETNYLVEAENLRAYAKIFETHPRYKVPRTIPDLCTQKVLAMSYEEGVTLRDWIKNTPDPERRSEMGTRVLDLYSIEYFDNGFVQSDPNPSNFLVNSRNELVLLDLGAVKTFNREFIHEYVALMKCVAARDEPATVRQGERMGFIDPREKSATREAFYEMLRSSLCAFDADRQPFDFCDKDYFKQTKVTTNAFGRLSEYSPPPYEIVFLHRKLVGVFGLLKDMQIKLDLGPYWHRVTNQTNLIKA